MNQKKNKKQTKGKQIWKNSREKGRRDAARCVENFLLTPFYIDFWNKKWFIINSIITIINYCHLLTWYKYIKIDSFYFKNQSFSPRI